jgi:pimeloyl-ACP methyl ester carboxylesterase
MKLIVSAMLLVCVGALLLWLWTPDKDRAALERSYFAVDDVYVEVAGCTVHLRDSGPKSAPSIVFVHGFGSSLQTWDAWAMALEKTYRVLRFDLPGSGLSPPDPTHDYTDRRSVELLAALQDRLGLARSTLVGHSIGGRIAWTFAALRPERVDKLVLVAPDGFASPGFRYGAPPEVPAVFKLMRYALPKSVLRWNLAAAYADPATLTDDLTTRYHDLMLAPGARGAMLDRMRQTVLVEPTALLRRIRAPTLLIWGERDAMIPFANSADYLKAIADVHLVAVENVGHLPQEERPESSLLALEAFLRQDSRGKETVR